MGVPDPSGKKDNLRGTSHPKSVVNGLKGLGKIKVDNINGVTLVRHARHRFLEDQRIGETGPKW